MLFRSDSAKLTHPIAYPRHTRAVPAAHTHTLRTQPRSPKPTCTLFTLFTSPRSQHKVLHTRPTQPPRQVAPTTEPEYSAREDKLLKHTSTSRPAVIPQLRTLLYLYFSALFFFWHSNYAAAWYKIVLSYVGAQAALANMVLLLFLSSVFCVMGGFFFYLTLLLLLCCSRVVPSLSLSLSFTLPSLEGPVFCHQYC